MTELLYCGVPLGPRTTSLALANNPLVPACLPELPEDNLLLWVNLSDTAVEDITALRRARYLRRLLLRGTLVEDLRPLAALTLLEDLILDDCPRLRDLRPLAKLANLRQLTFERTAVTDASIVDELPMLHWVRFAIPPPGPFGWIRGAGIVNIVGRPVDDLGPLAEARRMTQLRAARSGVRDLSPLRRLENLQMIDISHTRVRSLDPVSEIWNLRRLYIAHSDVEALGAARHGIALVDLDATGTRVDDLVEPPGWWMRSLRIGGTRIGPVPDLRACTRLRRLDISHLDHGDLGIIEGLRLRSLAFAHTAIDDLSPVGPGNLTWLDTRWSHVRSLAPLQVHRGTLRHLAIDVDQAPSVAELRGMQLTHLTIEGRGTSSVVDARWLCDLRHLEELELVDGGRIDDVRRLNRLRNLRRLVVPRATSPDALAALGRDRPGLAVELV
ncbi:MAG TPA: hypothetical protein VFQ53_23810 [Kofleriaceae bacterium]|nr:hypothetical protein [Kofleriaceae bacterium]